MSATQSSACASSGVCDALSPEQQARILKNREEAIRRRAAKRLREVEIVNDGGAVDVNSSSKNCGLPAICAADNDTTTKFENDKCGGQPGQVESVRTIDDKYAEIGFHCSHMSEISQTENSQSDGSQSLVSDDTFFNLGQLVAFRTHVQKIRDIANVATDLYTISKMEVEVADLLQELKRLRNPFAVHGQ